MATYIDLDSIHRITRGQPNSASYTVFAEQTRTWLKEARQVNAHSTRPGARAVEFSQSIQCRQLILPYMNVTYTEPEIKGQTTFEIFDKEEIFKPDGLKDSAGNLIESYTPRRYKEVSFDPPRYKTENIIGKSDPITVHTSALPRIYLDVHTERYNDKNLLNTIDNKVPSARFVLTQECIQYDASMNPMWVKFSARMDQVIRFARNESFVISIMQEQGHVITIDDYTTSGGVFDPNTNDIAVKVDPSGGTYSSVLTPSKDRQTYILLELVPYYRDGDYNNHALGLTQF